MVKNQTLLSNLILSYSFHIRTLMPGRKNNLCTIYPNILLTLCLFKREDFAVMGRGFNIESCKSTETPADFNVTISQAEPQTDKILEECWQQCSWALTTASADEKLAVSHVSWSSPAFACKANAIVFLSRGTPRNLHHQFHKIHHIIIVLYPIEYQSAYEVLQKLLLWRAWTRTWTVGMDTLNSNELYTIDGTPQDQHILSTNHKLLTNTTSNDNINKINYPPLTRINYQPLNKINH